MFQLTGSIYIKQAPKADNTYMCHGNAHSQHTREVGCRWDLRDEIARAFWEDIDRDMLFNILRIKWFTRKRYVADKHRLLCQNSILNQYRDSIGHGNDKILIACNWEMRLINNNFACTKRSWLNGEITMITKTRMVYNLSESKKWV